MNATSIDFIHNPNVIDVRYYGRQLPTPDELVRDLQLRQLSQNRIGTAPKQIEHSFKLLINGLVQQNITGKSAEDDYPTLLDPALVMRERLDQIKEQLALSVTQIAELFNVTRKSVYDWYEGAIPHTNKVSRMEVLIAVLSNSPASIDLRRLKSVWNIDIGDRSFREVFNDEHLDNANLQNAIATKLNELSPRMVTANKLVAHRTKSNVNIGEAHFSDFERQADYG